MVMTCARAQRARRPPSPEPAAVDDPVKLTLLREGRVIRVTLRRTPPIPPKRANWTAKTAPAARKLTRDRAKPVSEAAKSVRREPLEPETVSQAPRSVR